MYSYINTHGNWKNSKFCVDITVYQHGKCFIFLKYIYPKYKKIKYICNTKSAINNFRVKVPFITNVSYDI